MSAVRMVAYGVLEMKHKTQQFDPNWMQAHELEQSKKDDYERDQLRKLVNDELRRYGLLLTRMVTPQGKSWRTKNNTYILYGQEIGPVGFQVRETLHEGSFKDCCEVAAKLLDELDAAQVPEGKT